MEIEIKKTDSGNLKVLIYYNDAEKAELLELLKKNYSLLENRVYNEFLTQSNGYRILSGEEMSEVREFAILSEAPIITDSNSYWYFPNYMTQDWIEMLLKNHEISFNELKI